MDRLVAIGLDRAMTTFPPLSTSSPILVLGATGTTGRRVARGLAERGHGVRPGSRRADPPFEWTDPATWPAVVGGVSAAYVVFTPDLAVPGAVAAVREFARVATQAGVSRLVLLSGRGEPEAQRAEAELAAVADRAGAAWTVLRCSWFAQNFSESFLLPFVLDGTIVLPAADVPEPFVDVDDVAEVAVTALTDAGHGGRVYELTGPEALTFSAVADVLSRVSGRPVRYEPVSAAEFVSGAVAAGFSAEDAVGLAGLCATVLDGRNVLPQPGVRQALGREARSFSDFAFAAAETGAWALPVAP
jgi:uncharacterized protein YbjT (DUF2867 family)